MEQIILEFLFGNGQQQLAIAPLAALAIGSGALQTIGSFFGSSARKREQRRAQAQFNADRAAIRNFQFQNQFAGLENTYEDLTVNTRAAEFQAQQTDQALANTLQFLNQSGRGAGGAQAIANAALASKQGISSDIARQEEQNLILRSQSADQLQQLEAQGAQQQEANIFGQRQLLFQESGNRLAAANEARRAATAAAFSGLGNIAGGLLSGGLGGNSGGAGSVVGNTGAYNDFSRFLS